VVVKGLKYFGAGKQRAALTRLRKSIGVASEASAIEFNLLVALIATAVTGIVESLGHQLVPRFQTAVDGL
jgi:Flp pilus assembly pilin Flp